MRRRDELLRSRLKPTGCLMRDTEAILIAASVTPGCHRRRRRLAEEHRYIQISHNMPSPSAAFRRWVVVALSIRVPTTVISYSRTLVSLLGGQKQLDDDARALLAGVLTLYGTRAWFDRPPPATPEEVSEIVANESHPLWFRVRVDLEYNTISRDADLDYLRPSNVTERGHGWQVDFEFLKNNTSGAHGVLKMYFPRIRSLVVQYLTQVRSLGLERLFPQSQEEFRKLLNKALNRKAGTRSLRRGAAIAAGKTATPETIQTMLAHRDVGTQRTYTQTLTQQEYMQQQAVAVSLIGPPSPHALEHPQRSALLPPPLHTTQANKPLPPPPKPTPPQVALNWSFQQLISTTHVVSKNIIRTGNMTLIPPIIRHLPLAAQPVVHSLTPQQLIQQAMMAAMVISPIEDD